MGVPTPPRQRLVTQQQYDKELAAFDAGNRDYQGPADAASNDTAEMRQRLIDSMIVPPAPAPDLSDELVKQRAMQIRRRLLMGGMVGPLNLSPGAVVAPKLGGY
jgi:hypothetical protein